MFIMDKCLKDVVLIQINCISCIFALSFLVKDTEYLAISTPLHHTHTNQLGMAAGEDLIFSLVQIIFFVFFLNIKKVHSCDHPSSLRLKTAGSIKAS